MIVAAFVAYLIVYHNASSFTYRGVTYNIEQDGQITFYGVKVPLMAFGKNEIFSIFIRHDARALEKHTALHGH